MTTGFSMAAISLALAAVEPPVIPVGLDAYRQWDRWPYQRIGCRAYMRSTYDRAGGNEAADASHFLYQLAEDRNVTLDVAGPGVLYFVRTNHWHGSPWHYVVDGVDHVITETSTADPDHPVAGSVFEPREALPNPLTWTWSVTHGADLMWVPIPFERSLQLAYARTHYGTGYYIYHQYVPGARLSQPIRSWDGRTPPDPAVLDLLNRAGSDIVGSGEGVQAHEMQGAVEPGRTTTLFELNDGPSMVRAIDLSVPREQAANLGRCRIVAHWDGRKHPSINAPVPLFFGAGTLYNRDNREFLVKGLPMVIRFDEQRIHLACYYPMPFFRSAKVALVTPEGVGVAGLEARIRRQPYLDPPEYVGYFHATYADHPQPQRGHDLVCLDTVGTEGGGPWSGQFVGMSWIFSHKGVLNTLEGDPRFFFDTIQTPQAQGTGTEEWGGGGDYWGGRNMTLPLAGHPVGARDPKEAKCPEDLIQSAYRFLLADLMPFGRRAVIRLEHGGTNESTEHYETVCYWYGLPGSSLETTDTLVIADPGNEAAHQYDSPQATPPTPLTSRYEWGVDTLDGREIYGPMTYVERHTTGESSFTMKLRPDNLGVMLRRTFDYSWPNQRAEVFVAEAQASGEPNWKPAGIWYTAGSNTCVYSNPKAETGPAQHIVQTSNRRFRSDEFLIGRELSAGRSAIRIRIKHSPVAIPLHPGRDADPTAWSEISYSADCFVIPQTKAGVR